MTAQLKEGLHGDLTIEGQLKTTQSHGFVHVGCEWLASSVSKVFFIANRPYRVKNITARVEVAGTDGGGVTAVIGKVPSGTAVASQTALHSGSINLKGTAATKQILT